MAIRPALTLPLLLCLSTGAALCQPLETFLGLLDKSSRTFTGARANIRSTVHTQGVDEDDTESGVFIVRRSGSEPQFRIDFKDPNNYIVVVRDQHAEVYHPKLNETDVYDLRAYKDIAQKLFLLGFGMPGKELAANYEIRNLKQDSIEGQGATYVELVPKSPDVKNKLKSIEVWISAKTLCPLRQVFHLPDGSSRSAQFSALELNPKLPPGAFDLPKGAKRVKVN